MRLLGLVLASELPRRWLERELSRRLEATVELDRLRLRRFPEVVIEGLRIEEMAGLPHLLAAELPRVETVLRLRRPVPSFGEVRIAGARVRLAPVCGEPLRPPRRETEVRVERLVMEALEIVVSSETAAPLRVVLDSEMALGDPARPAGSLAATAPRLEAARIAALWQPDLFSPCRSERGGTDPWRETLLEGVGLELHFGHPAPGRGEGLVVEASGRASELRTELGSTVPVVSEVRLDLLGQLGGARSDAELRLELGTRGRLRLDLERDADRALLALEATVENLDLGFWGPLLLAADEVALELEGRGEGSLSYDSRRGGELEILTDVERVRAQTPEGGFWGRDGILELTGKLEPTDTGGLPARLPFEVGLRWRELGAEGLEGLGLAGVAARLGGQLSRNAEGAVVLEEGSASFAAELEVGGRLTGSGTVRGGPSNRTELTLDWAWSGERLAGLLHSLEGQLPWQLPADWKVAGALAARGRVAGPVLDPALEAEILVEGLLLEGPDLSYEAERTEVGWRSSPAETDPRGSSLLVSSHGLGRFAGLSAVPLRLRLEAGLVGADTLRLERGELDAGKLGRLLLSSPQVWPLEGPYRGGGRLELEGADLGSWRVFLQGEEPSTSAHRLETTGNLSAVADWRLDGEEVEASGEWGLADGTLSSPDGSRVLAPIAWRWQFDGGLRDGTLRLASQGDVVGPELLWGALYADLGALRAQASLDLALPVGDSSTEELRATAAIGLRDHTRFQAALRQGEEGWRYSAELRLQDLSRGVDELIRGPFDGTGGWLGRVEGAAGEMVAHFDGSWSAGAGSVVQGVVEGSGIGLAVGKELRVEDLDLHLPLELQGIAGGLQHRLATSGTPLAGWLRHRGLVVSGLELPPLEATVTLAGNVLRLEESLGFELLDGRIELQGLRLVAPLSSERRLEAAVGLHSLSLESISDTFGLFPLEGTIDGSFPRILVTSDVLSTEGSGELELFGGRVTVERIVGTEIWSPFPRFLFAARFEDLDLRELTRTVEFGEITGRIAGGLEEVELVGGSPVRLRGGFRSVEIPGVAQRVSLKAAENLARLGTGADARLSGRKLPSFLQSYPYVGLGVELELFQDRFLLRGLERRGDKELFLKGRLPLRLDIVNVRPGATVSFKTMMSRLQNLEIERGPARDDGVD